MDEKENKAVKKCSIMETLVFLTALIAGTACSICSKTVFEMRGIGIDGEVEAFEKPIFQTFAMFVGMLVGLVMHWIVIFWKIPFPGYDHTSELPTAITQSSDDAATERDPLIQNKTKCTNNLLQKKDAHHNSIEDSPLPFWMYIFLAIPSIFDIGCTTLCMIGLVYLDVSIYQLLRGSTIIFVAFLKQYMLRDRLYRFQWIGVMWNVISVLLVGATALLNTSGEFKKVEPVDTVFGVTLVLLGAFIQSLQFVFEEKVMTMEIPVKPLLLIGMEGFWGTLICIIFVYPLVYYLPGSDHGSFEDPFNTWAMMMNSPVIMSWCWAYVLSIFVYNVFAVLVTYMLNSVWHAILDNFRPMAIWSASLFIFYVIDQSGNYGERWTYWSYIQLISVLLLLYSTSIYNAPNPGSIQLRGQWFSLGVNLSEEYEDLEFNKNLEDVETVTDDLEWQRINGSPLSSVYSE